jgi:hypothetical protein
LGAPSRKRTNEVLRGINPQLVVVLRRAGDLLWCNLVNRVLQPIAYFVTAVCLLVPPFVMTEGWPRLLLMAISAGPACLAVWLGIEGIRSGQRRVEDDD